MSPAVCRQRGHNYESCSYLKQGLTELATFSEHGRFEVRGERPRIGVSPGGVLEGCPCAVDPCRHWRPLVLTV